MPVYNKASYLRQSIESVLAQTMATTEGALEIICIDDGSTDGSLDILTEYEQRPDCPLRVLRQKNEGPGVARNAGLDVAQGEFVHFLDSDDFIEPDTYERALARAEKLDADIVIWDMWQFNDRLGRDQHPPVGTLTFDAFVPWDQRETKVFAAADNPDAIFTSFQNWPWNKLFRRSFIEQRGLRFPAMHRTEDLPFVCMALVRARRMAVIYERFSHYRIHTGTSAMDCKDSHPRDFIDAFLLFKHQLEEAGLYETYRTSYVRWALSGVVNNLNPLRDPETFSAIFHALKNGVLDDMDINTENLVGYGNRFELDALSALRTRDEAGYLRWLSLELEDMLGGHRATIDILECERDEARGWAFSAEERIVALEHELEVVRCERDEARRDCDNLLRSAEYRSGKMLCKVPRAVQGKLRKR